jgi:predicted dehydrogenase
VQHGQRRPDHHHLGGRRAVEGGGHATSYTYQLEAFIRAVRGGAPYRTDADDAVATMSLIDDCYRSLGLPPRPTYA